MMQLGLGLSLTEKTKTMQVTIPISVLSHTIKLSILLRLLQMPPKAIMLFVVRLSIVRMAAIIQTFLIFM